MMAQPEVKAVDYTKIYWVEAFVNIMQEPEVEQLTQEKFYFYSRVLVSHTLANNILKDLQLKDANYVTQLVDDFYECYKQNRQSNKNALLTSVFMQTLINIDVDKIRLTPNDTGYITEIGLPCALEAKKCVHLLDDADKKTWLISYMYAKTSPEVIKENVKLRQSLGKEAHRVYLENEKYISSGPSYSSTDGLKFELSSKGAKEAMEYYTNGWYARFGKNEFSLDQVKSLKSVMKRPHLSEILNVDPRVLYVYAEYRLAQAAMPIDSQDLYWKTKISNIDTFIKQVSKNSDLAAAKT